MSDQIIRHYAASVYLKLRTESIKTVFYDHMDASDVFERDVLGKAARIFHGRKIYGVAVFLGNKKNALRLMRKIRKLDPSGLLVAFGPFAAAFYRHILERDLADAVVLADPDLIFPKLCRSGMDPGLIPNLAYRQRGRILLTRRQIFDNLDGLPFAGQYFCERGELPVPVITSRGCASACSFCDRPPLWGSRFRMRSIEDVYIEIDTLVRQFGVKLFAFHDASLVITKNRTALLCRKLRNLPHPISWTCSTRVDSVDFRTLRLMKLAGCDIIYFGVESADVQVLKRMGKQYGLPEIKRAVNWARDAGLKVGIFLMVGCPGESKRSLRMAKKLICDLYPFYELTVNPAVVLPGTPLYRDMVRRGQVNGEDYFERDGISFFDDKRQLYMAESAALKKFFEK